MSPFDPFGPRLPSTSGHWASPEFRSELTAWLTAVVGEPTSLEPQKIRAWAGGWRVETEAGVFFAKQNCPTQQFEAALLAELAAPVPHSSGRWCRTSTGWPRPASRRWSRLRRRPTSSSGSRSSRRSIPRTRGR